MYRRTLSAHILSMDSRLEVINRSGLYKHSMLSVHKHIFMTESLFILQSVIYTRERHYRITEKSNRLSERNMKHYSSRKRTRKKL